MNSFIKYAKYRLSVFVARLGVRMAASASKKIQTRLDRFNTRLIEKALQPESPAEDHMRDEIVDADIGFDAEELARYQSKK